ncbi:adenosylcobinamide amidohydrolase [Rossellomorea aquimaris]|jgi:iron complex transport system ATP-binding protein|uniref:Adenosylcobinamide amidohydrolase n=2 Tax=Rossellomorea aquimaris TaxID=189382 RepID=A0A5D4U9F0_9BACI|nr:adenosylcobinamide amidohydrolase [Rossellomorea aquimaris]TYS76813.1 adenosylcobinamide amidohydrolase [Rossellomorea aquimaris]TYS83718.1 adenosylcobinamide amidohydrolase [Rossellomorea aquimaris]
MKREIINHHLLTCSKNQIILQSTRPLKTISSGVTNAGTGWYTTFVNRHVSKNYNSDNHHEEMQGYLQQIGAKREETVGMMTAVQLEDACWGFYEEESFSVFIVVTAGVGNAVDASMSDRHSFDHSPGTINIWVFINGRVSEAASIQGIMTATEAKVKALAAHNVKDPVTGSGATGTSTDSILIASTEEGVLLEYAGTITPLGKRISKGVYECTIHAISKYKKRVGT